MTANELADNQLTHVIGENNNGEEVVITLRKPLYPESFVRQQQAEIEALKAAKIRAYDNGVEDGRKPNTNNKPVAWMSKKGILSYVNDMGFTIPLYTHPVKELTDEEINKLWAESHEDGIAMQQGFTTQQHYFAHLILRKA